MIPTDRPDVDEWRHERQNSAWLASKPLCYACQEPIQDDICYEVNGRKYCCDCQREAWRSIRYMFVVETTH